MNNKMGMRRNIALHYDESGADGEIKKNPATIYLYTHWGAVGLEDGLAKSLDRARERWGDDTYLARVIASDMFADAGDDLTGYGLAPYECDPEFDTLHVDLPNKKVNDVPFEDFIKNPQMFKI